MSDSTRYSQSGNATLRGARCTESAYSASLKTVKIVSGSFSSGADETFSSSPALASHLDLDLSGYMLLPGLVNAHDHLQFALYSKLGDGPYKNYVDWGADIHDRYADVITMHHTIPREVRLWWGGIRNLLSGVTTVCHHDTLWPELRRGDFPVRVLDQYGWGHSLALGGDLENALEETPAGVPFIMHACEGVDALAKHELPELKRLDLLKGNTVLVHGLAMNEDGSELLRSLGVSLILCPSSNDFLFQRLPSSHLARRIEKLALGSDSPLTARGDLLDEGRFAVRRCGFSPEEVYSMVTEGASAVLRLHRREGEIAAGGVGDLIATRDQGMSPAETLASLSMNTIELVMIGGHVQLASSAMWERLPEATRQELEPLRIEGTLRWLRAPVSDLLQKAEAVLGVGQVCLGGQALQGLDSHRGDA